MMEALRAADLASVEREPNVKRELDVKERR